MANLDALLRIRADVQGQNSIVALNRGLQGVERTAAGASVAMRGMAGSSALLAGSLGALAPLLSAAGLVGMVKGAIDAGDAMNDLSQRTGVSVEALAKFKKAAATSGTDIDAVAKSLGKLSKGMFEVATTGKGKAADALNALGISATDAAGKLKTADAVTLEIADRFKAMPDGVTKTALAMALFGKSGAEMIPMLNEGGKAIDALSVKMTAAFAKKADEYSDKLAILGGKVGALGMDLAIALLPALNAVTDAVTAGVTAFNGMPGPLKSATLSAAALALAWGPLTSVIKGSAALMALFSASTATAGAAATAATPRIVALRSALGGLLKFGLITLGIDVVISGMSKLVELQARLNKVTGRSTNDYFGDIGGSAASREKLQAELANVRKQQQALKKEAASVRFPWLTGQDEAAKAGLLVAQAREAKLLSRISRARPQAQIPAAAAGALDLSGYGNGAGGAGAGPAGSGSTGTKGMSPAAQIATALKSALGLTDAQAAGIVGNLMRESGLNPRVNEGGAVGLPRGVGGYGLAQWTGSRQTDLVRFAGGRGQAGDMATQLRFMVSEMMGPESASLAKLKTAQSPEQAAYLFDKHYERSGIKAMGERQGNARRVFGELAGGGAGAGLADYGQQLQDQAKEAASIAEKKKKEAEQTAQQLTAARDLLATSEAQLEVAVAMTPLEKAQAEYNQARSERMRDFAERFANVRSNEERQLLVTAQITKIAGADLELAKKKAEITDQQVDAERERAQALQESLSYMQELSSRDSIGAGFQQGIQSYVDSIGNMRDAVGQLTTDTIGGLENALTELATTGTVKFREFAVSVLKDTAAMIMRQLVLKTIMSAIGGLGGSTTAKTFEMPGAGFLPTNGSYAFPSMEGGGYTGSGARSGGVDGRGGFMAVLHPNETVTDHMRSGPAIRRAGGATSYPAIPGIPSGGATSYPAIPGIPSGGAGGGMDGSPDALGAAGGGMPGQPGHSSISRFERTDAVLTRMVEAAKQDAATQAAITVAASSGGPVRVQLETTRINSVDYVTLEQAQGIANAAASRSTARERRALQANPAARRGVGI
jgi:lambda family phage tail tape measure protein